MSGTVRLLLLTLLIHTGLGWWPWGEEVEETKEQMDVVASGEAEVGAGLVNKVIQAAEIKIEANLAEEESKQKISEKSLIKDNTAASEEPILRSPEVLEEFNRKSFEEKFDETIKNHEALHGSKPVHFDAAGNHNSDFDHEAFLGDESEQFTELSPEEARVKLGLVVNKIDTDNNTLVTEAELTVWIRQTARRSAERRTEQFWSRNNPDGKEEISWDEYRARQYGFLTDHHITDTEGRWTDEEDVDPHTLAIYKQLELRDRRRWTVADRNKNLWLSKVEFSGFIHPEHEEHMSDVLISETMADFDHDGDGKLNLAEYVKNIFGDTKEVSDWDTGGIQFRAWRDLDHDGFIDKAELKAWMMPQDYDQHQSEAAHLIHEADRDGDKQLTKTEILESQSVFVSSQATDFGEDLHFHHDEL